MRSWRIFFLALVTLVKDHFWLLLAAALLVYRFEQTLDRIDRAAMELERTAREARQAFIADKP